jgi:tetratricopeptide (TPR) repeat protein
MAVNTLQGTDALQFAMRSYLIENMGDTYEASGYHAEAANTLSRALRQWTRASRESIDAKAIPVDLTQGIPTRMRKSVLHHKIAVSSERNSDYDLALRHLDLSFKELPPRQPSQEAKIAITKSLSFFRKGLYEEAITCGSLGLRMARRSGDPHDLAYAYNILASSYLDVGNIKKAIRYRQSAIHLYDQLGNIPGQAQAHNNLGACYQSLGNQRLALHHFELSLMLCERIGNISNTGIAHNNVGEVLLTLGNLDESMYHLKKVVETYDTKGDPLAACGLALVNMSRAYQRKQCLEQAFDALNRGKELLRKAQARGLLAEALLQQAELELETSQIDRAVRTCKQVLKDTQELGLRLLQARGLHIMGRLNIARESYGQGETDLRRSIALARSINADYDRGLALLYLAELFIEQMQNKKDSQGYRSLLNRAAAIFKRVGAEADLKQVQELQHRLRSVG